VTTVTYTEENAIGDFACSRRQMARVKAIKRKSTFEAEN